MYDDLNTLSKAQLKVFLARRSDAWHYMSGYLDGKGMDIDPAYAFSELYAKMWLRRGDARACSVDSMLSCRDNFLAGRPVDITAYGLDCIYADHARRDVVAQAEIQELLKPMGGV